MAKKRRDNERDKSTRERLSGYTKAAAATIAGVAFFNRKGTKDFRAISSTSRNVINDLSGKKKTASNILDALDRRVGKGGSVYKETRNNIQNQKIKISKVKGSSDTKGIMGIFKDRNERMNTISDLKRHNIEKRKSQIINKVINNYGNEKDNDLLKDIVKNAYDNIEKENGIYKSNKDGKIIRHKDFLSKKINMLSQQSKEKIGDIFEDVYNARIKANEEINDKNFILHAEKIAGAMSEQIIDPTNMSNFLKTKSTGRYAKIDSIIKNLTGVELDTEDLLTGSRKATVGEVLDEYRRHKNGEDTSFDFSSFNYIAKDKKNNGFKKVDFMEELEKTIKETEGFEESIRNLNFGHNIRVKTNIDGTNEFFSSAEVDGYVDKAVNWFSQTLPGGLLKSMDFY